MRMLWSPGVEPLVHDRLDLLILALLLRWRPKQSFFVIRRAVVVLIVGLLVGVSAAVAMGRYSETTFSDAGEVFRGWQGSCA